MLERRINPRTDVKSYRTGVKSEQDSWETLKQERIHDAVTLYLVATEENHRAEVGLRLRLLERLGT